MKDFLKQQLELKSNNLHKVSLVREYLQARILQGLQETGAFINWAFLGGTALRFLYNIPRYSEDLDFSVVNPETDCRFEDILLKIKSLFEAENYQVSIKVSSEKTVKSAFIKFPGLLYELNISPHQSEVLSIKIEIDTNPPYGAETETTIIRRFVTVNINHYDRASLLAGKLHAVLSRQYTKGRDLYDLIWYLSNPSWPIPNLKLLNASLQQTDNKKELITEENLQGIMANRMSDIHWKKVQDDLLPFLERPHDIDLVTKGNCLKLILSKF